MINLEILAQIFKHEDMVNAYMRTVFIDAAPEVQQEALAQVTHSRQVLMSMIEELEKK